MATDDISREVILTKSKMNMVYRIYTLHPHVDDYLYYNYPHYKTIQLIQKTYYLAQCDKKELNGFTASLSIPIMGNICTDIYISLGNLHPTCIENIHVYINGYRNERGIYNMDWLTIYLYNIRHYPEMVLRNIFILPNLTLISSALYTYTIDINFEHTSLYEHVFEPWRNKISAIMQSDIGMHIMNYVPNHIQLEIWGRTDNDKIHSTAINPQIFSMLKSAFKSIYMTNYLLDCNSEVATSINIHKNMMHNNILFSYICKDAGGHWIAMPQFNKLIIRIDNNIHIITEHEISILPCLYNVHYVKKMNPIKEYSIPSKFILTHNITTSGSHPYMYLLQLSDHIDHSLIMGNEEDEYGNIITLTFIRNTCALNTQLYVELSTK